ncbi:natural product biosynthesis luciferase-like monooxygenase domain-containing protein [Gemmobacter aquatilis]|uniref:Natural product biosynthesis luciferase-like monooxygenase domain-containing protein n=1 Tax=Gemmobacter aquatilis TaxID=933059 RepID=A0A1H8JVS6_9RHOB|nr:MupA/Atu3671 family FMN-dependent luciferase-like monooxygenase [Gemmobacter aquatilis]SEN84318.1 natural product biosynthesis luciferase-like monooxygenase domain-containing protein [Gemmobacter aquatilis]
MNPFSCYLIGNESLTRECGEMLLARGHAIAALITRNPDVRAWGQAKGLSVLAQDRGWDAALPGQVDWLLSIANLSLVPEAALALARQGGVNFHDGPLPRHAGLNAPVWAILAQEPQHGITWHMITAGVDEGEILDQRLFPVLPSDTALTLNTRCFEAAIDSFPALIEALALGAPHRRAQDFTQRTVHTRADRPAAAGRLDFTRTAAEVAALVRALDHGTYWNPLTCAKLWDGGRYVVVGGAEVVAGAGVPGQVLAATEDDVTVACGAGAVRLTRLTCQKGFPVSGLSLPNPLASASPAEAAALTAALARVAPQEPAQRKALLALDPAEVAGAAAATAPAFWQSVPVALPSLALGALAAVRLSGKPVADLAFGAAHAAEGILSDWVPLRVAAEGALPEALARVTTALDAAAAHPGFALDLLARDRKLFGLQPPAFGLGLAPVPGTVVTLAPDALHYDASRLTAAQAEAMAARIAAFAAAAQGDARVETLPVLTPAELDEVLYQHNRTATPYDASLCVHQAFEAQVARSPDAVAVVFEGESLTYAQLNARANRAAQVLIGMGVRPGTLVGLHLRRSLNLLIGALAIQKAGGAYVPMDPAYPADRTALYIEDSACPVIVTQAALEPALPAHQAQVLCLDTDGRLGLADAANPASGVTSADLAYMIYTSGSTGRPKGVMVEHRNVANFFAGMDGRIDHASGSVWLAVTSLSFDISVLELFWTLARGFKLVLTSDENRALVSNGTIASAQGMEFSLYYWGNDDGVGPKKYELLLNGARFADEHGFCAVWTPERHFHAFGGPYPNPSVTGAAVAAVTKNIGVRAGSVVLPLHHPARVAEDWAVIDNLTNGRAGLAIASGWQPDDFVLRPENTPPNNRAAMFDGIAQLRRLWRGEAVEFPTKTGTFGVVTQPRPVSQDLPIWVTTAGNPATWREAGEIGANVLTHLLGQSIDEVAGKIAIYHDALRKAGHDPAQFKVTLMLHTYVCRDREQARRVAEKPMKDYLAAAVGLVKQYAWAFPAFKKPQGIENPMDIDLRTLSAEENEAILDFAFQRYFEDSGLFGTVEDALARVESLKRIGVTEVACLIDYGIAPEAVMEGLYPLAEVLRRANAGAGPAADDYSIAAQIIRHKVTHLQCTPSMARMIMLNDEAQMALAGVKTLMLGGEALPGAFVSDLRRVTQAKIENMYGPTETTIWSTTETAQGGEGVVNIGTPIANTQLYVLDDRQQPVPPGTAGELWIGGDGVTRGYWQRPDLTAERFLPDPFIRENACVWGARMYRTGDLVRLRADGKLDYLGRADYQVKLRGYRIELGEIESTLEAQPGVSQAVVLAREDQPGDLRLVAYVTGTASAETLKPALAALLPDHMIPAHFVRLDSFPLTPNRKVDRKALPAPQAQVEQAAHVAPEAGLEAQIAAIWQKVLGVPKVGAKDNFFALGGHSLLAVQAHRELRDGLGLTKLSITDIFRFPTLSALAAHLEGAPKPATPAAAPANTAAQPQGLADRAEARADAMARRRALRGGRVDG